MLVACFGYELDGKQTLLPHYLAQWSNNGSDKPGIAPYLCYPTCLPSLTSHPTGVRQQGPGPWDPRWAFNGFYSSFTLPKLYNLLLQKDFSEDLRPAVAAGSLHTKACPSRCSAQRKNKFSSVWFNPVPPLYCSELFFIIHYTCTEILFTSFSHLQHRPSWPPLAWGASKRE